MWKPKTGATVHTVFYCILCVFATERRVKWEQVFDLEKIKLQTLRIFWTKLEETIGLQFVLQKCQL